MIFLRPANQMLLRRAAGRGAAAAVRPRNNVRVWPTTLTSLPSSGDDNFSTRTPTTRRGFAGAAANRIVLDRRLGRILRWRRPIPSSVSPRYVLCFIFIHDTPVYLTGVRCALRY